MGFVYISGPYRGQNAIAHDHTVYPEISKNIAEATRWAIKLANDSVPYFCPHMNSAHMEVAAPEAHPDYWLWLDIKILEGAWGVLLIPGWHESAGAWVEKKYAEEHGIPVYYYTQYDELVKDWYDQNQSLKQYLVD